MDMQPELGGELGRAGAGGLPRPRRTVDDAAHTPVVQLMSREVVTVREDQRVEEAQRLMLDKELSRVPVVNEEGTLAGMLSRTDLLRHQPIKKGARVSQVMMRSTLRLRESATVAQAAELMALQHVHGIPVVSPEGRVVGMVSALDVMGWVAGLI
ncbi:MAG: CBS domain-containing protein [Myxococcota bacterium]